MSKRIFTREQIEQLTKNKSIASCTEKSITYTQSFKASAIKLYAQGLTSSEVFRQAGFNLEIIGRDQPKECLRRWNKIFSKKGYDGLSEVRGRGGGRFKTKYQTDKEKIKYLEAQVAYLKAENDFLAKLRANKKR